MKLELFMEYMRLCNLMNVCPTWKGLQQFKEVFS